MTACDGYDGTLTDSGRRRQDMRLNGNSAANRINMNRVYNGKTRKCDQDIHFLSALPPVMTPGRWG